MLRYDVSPYFYITTKTMYMCVIQGDVQQNKKFKVKMLQGYSYICHRCIISENTFNVTIIEIYTISTF